MAAAPQKIREATFQMLYSFDLGNNTEDAIVELISKELTLPKSVAKTVKERVKAILTHLKEIDALIAKVCHSYEFERIHTVERNILRLGIYELLYDPSIPEKVVFAECMRLATKFSAEEAGAFIHAILDAVVKTRAGEPLNDKKLKEIAKAAEKSEREIQHVIEALGDNKSSGNLKKSDE